MSEHAANTWAEANQRYLMEALAEVRGMLEAYAAPRDGSATEIRAHDRSRLAEAAAAMPSPAALDSITGAFGLSPFERQILLLCAGAELDATFAALLARANGDAARAYATFGLALAALPGPHWSALTPDSPLRRWGLITVGSGSSLATSPLRIDERVIHYLAGVSCMDTRLIGFVEPVDPAPALVPSHRELAHRIASVWTRVRPGEQIPIVQLCGPDTHKREIAAAACAELGLRLYAAPASGLPGTGAELETFVRLWLREVVLGGTALVLETDQAEESGNQRDGQVARLIDRLTGPLIVATRERRADRVRSSVVFHLQRPTPTEQRQLWSDSLEGGAGNNGMIDRLVAQFDLGARAIRSAAIQSTSTAEVWDACRESARPALESLAQLIDPRAGWDDLVLPEGQLRTLRQIAVHVRQRATVYEQWGFRAKSSRGLGISALFAGASGTGKTMAAEVLARELKLDLFRIDLSSVVSKYIGETEKNLRRLFDAAEDGGAILFFDEADALFGKRSEVKDSHDRYANIEVSYLLQRMEAYRGLAILTTNMKQALDTAFLRRLRFIVEFPFPAAKHRQEIWRRAFPAGTPTSRLDLPRLAQLSVAGGTIANIALGAAFIAAEAGEPVRMSHVLEAARSEYAKMEKALTGSEIEGWGTLQ